MKEMKNTQKMLHISNDVVNAPKFEMTKRARFIFYTILRIKLRELFDNNIDFALQDISLDPATLTLRDYKKIFKGNKSFPEMKKEIKSIPANFSILKKDKDGNIYEKIVYMFTEANIRENNKSIDFYFNELALEYFANEYGKFAKMDLNELYKLNSSYAIRLYEFICARSAGKGKLVNPLFGMKIEDFKEYFGISKNTQTKYIYAFYLKKAIKEIEEKTKFRVKYVTQKRGNDDKIVTHIFLDICEI